MKTFCLIVLLVATSLTSPAQTKQLPEISALPEQPGLPDPLIMFDGRPVGTAAKWRNERRPELKELFQYYMYGYLPPAPKIKVISGKTYRDFINGKATAKEFSIDLGKTGAPRINVLLLVPNKRSGRVPVIAGINFCGNHSAVPDKRVTLNTNWMPEKICAGTVNNRATEESRGKSSTSWDIERAIDRGYAVATFYYGDIAPDTPDFSMGVFPYFRKAGQVQMEPHDWGNIAAWAWGFHRVVDALQMESAIDPKRIAVFGHSRNGKAAILAGAMDERIALVFAHQAGCGGTAPSRGTIGESVKAINDRFPHWFNDVFPQFNDQVKRLPFDQNSLIALVAPRPVLLSNAVDDTWSNPAGQFEMLRSADKVYRLLNAGGLDAATMPEPGRLVDSKLGYFIRPGKHSTLSEDWKVFLDFADRNLR